MSENKKNIEKALENIQGTMNPNEEQMEQLKKMADKYGNKSQDDIFSEIIKLNEKLSSDIGETEFKNKLRQLEAIRPMLNEEQNKKLDKVLDALKK